MGDAMTSGQAGMRTVAVALAAFLGLAACTEPDPVLPGLREDVASVFTDPSLATPTEIGIAPNESRPISLAAPTTNSNWTHHHGSPAMRVTHAALSAAPQQIWRAKIGQGDGRRTRITADPVVSDGRVFTLDAGALVTATSTAGATLWQVDLTPANDRAGQATGGGIAVDGDTVYVSVGFGLLTALDVSNGSQKWQQELDASGSGRPTVFGDLVYLTAGDDTGWALDKTNGRVMWQIGGINSIANVLGAPAPVVTSELAIFAFGSGDVQAVLRRGGLSRWSAPVVGKRNGRALSSITDLTSTPVAVGDTLYVGNQSGRLAAIDLGNGGQKWVTREGASGPAWVAGGSVFVISDLNELLRLDAEDGSRIWAVPLPNFTKARPRRQSEVTAHHGPILAGGRIIVASGDGALRSFDPTDGTLTHTVEIPKGATTGAVVAGGTLYVVSRDGSLLAFR